MNYEGVNQDLSDQIEELKRQPQPEPAPANTTRRARSDEDEEDEDEDERPVKARKGEGHLTAHAVKRNAKLRLQAKHLAFMGMLWLPKPSGEEKLQDDGVDVLEAALTSPDPFPTTAPAPAREFYLDDFQTSFTRLRWEIYRVFGQFTLERYAKDSWFPGVVRSLHAFSLFVYLHVVLHRFVRA
jgi:hypothetical protein